jgi:hypothetical protein
MGEGTHVYLLKHSAEEKIPSWGSGSSGRALGKCEALSSNSSTTKKKKKRKKRYLSKNLVICSFLKQSLAREMGF